MRCVTRKQTLRSLLLSYQEKDWWAGPHQSFFWYDTDYKIYSVKVADYRFTVDVMPKEGLMGPGCESLFWYDNDKDLKVAF